MNHRQRAFLLAAIALYIVGVACADFLTPLVLDVWVLYLPVILVPVWFSSSRQIIVIAVVCSLLMIGDASLPHPNTPRIRTRKFGDGPGGDVADGPGRTYDC